MEFLRKRDTSFARDLSLENSEDSYLCFLLVLLHSTSYSIFLYQLLLCLCSRFLILINLTKMDFSQSTHWLMHLSSEILTPIIRADFPILVEQIINVISQIINFHTQIHNCDSHSPAFLYLFISSDSSI